MDIANLSMAIANVKMVQNLQVNVLKKALEQMEQTGAQMVEMINNTEVPAEGSVDIRL